MTVYGFRQNNSGGYFTEPAETIIVVDAKSKNHALEVAEKAQKSWKKLPARTRAEYMYKFADEIDARADYLAKLLVQEQGKLLKVAG